MNTSSTQEKLFVDANSLLNDAFLLGENILSSGYLPTILLALWRGGTPVGIAIEELLVYREIPHEHYPVKTRHYEGIGKRQSEILIEGLEPVMAKITHESRVLIVDDVFDTGLTLDKLINQIRSQSTIKSPNIRVATPWFKPANNLTTWKPDYFLHQTDRWIVFPHELEGLSQQELREGKAELSALKKL